MIELIVTDMNGANAMGDISRAVARVDRKGRAHVDAGGWLSIRTDEAPARFVSAIREAGYNAVVWWDGRR